MTTTNTPRTDACPHCGAELYSFPNQSDETTYWRCGTRFSRCLKVYFRQSGSCYERQLAELKSEVERLRSTLRSFILVSPIEFERMEKAEAEVERLTKKLSITEDELADAREWLDERYKATSEADERAEKAEAKVERLREALDTLTLIVGLTPVAGNKEALQEAYDLARKALNPTDK